MLKIAPQNVQQRPQINQSSTARSGNQVQEENIKNTLKAKMKCFIVMAVIILAVTLLISLAAMVLSILSYNASSKSTGLKTQRANLSEILVQFNTYKLDVETMLKQINSTLLLQNSVQNAIVSQLTVLQRNISQLFMELDAVYRFLIPVQVRVHCGDGLWHRVAHLNMSDPSQQCPSAWREYNVGQFRVCGRPVSTSASRPFHTYPTNHWYSKVCGRVIGIQVSSPDAFDSNRGINGGYIDGVSITHGSPRNHIWSYVGSYSEIAENNNVCPCDYSSAVQSPPFVGNNYYCESDNPTEDWMG